MKKASVAAILCALCLLLCACGADSAVSLVKDGAAQYIIVVPADAPDYWKADVQSFASELTSAVGADFSVADDSLPADGAACEILLGNVARAETEAFVTALEPGQYGYQVTGAKIVIAGRTYETNRLALQAFLRDLASYQTDGGIRLPGELCQIYKEDSLVKADGTEISYGTLKINCLGASNTKITKSRSKETIKDINYPALLAELLHCTVRNYGDSGTNIAKSAGRSDSYYERMTAMDKDADIIILQGEGNDATHKLPLGSVTDTDPTTFCGALRSVIAYIEETYPNGKLIILSGMSKKKQPDRPDHLTHEDFHAAFMAVCRDCGYEPHDFTLDEKIQPTVAAMMPDGLHMTPEACQRYSEIVAELIRDTLKK